MAAAADIASYQGDGAGAWEALVAAADAFLKAQGVRRPDRFADALLPGPWPR